MAYPGYGGAPVVTYYTSYILEILAVRCQECRCKWDSRCQEQGRVCSLVDTLDTQLIRIITPQRETPCGHTSLPLLARKEQGAFSLETCRIMIAMLDRDYTGKMGFNEFKELWAALNAWKQNFITIDQDRSGTVEPHELNEAIAAMGYRLSPQTLTVIVKRYSKNGRIFFDDYVACCVKLRALTAVGKLLEFEGEPEGEAEILCHICHGVCFLIS
ncbi:Grancalcin [Camelus dromedarius]|uniref:Grancalcin n=1 Tax=Camelus dromedarius TaxID=9838 RepID=A0A5N4E5T1_CAMDR|nr:Grancalcin [Camelus dromedarius]